jgi:hypothetical protein
MKPRHLSVIVSATTALFLCMIVILTCSKKPTDVDNPLDNPPYITKTMPNADVGVNDTVRLWVAATDKNGTVEKYFWRSARLNTTDSTDDSLHQLVYTAAGRDTVRAWVRDNERVYSDTADIHITVHSWKPYFTKVQPDTMVREGDTVVVRVVAADTNSADSSLRYLWAINSSAFADTNHTGLCTLTCSKNQMYLVLVKALDPQEQTSAVDTIRIIARGNAPIILAPVEAVRLAECYTRITFSPGWYANYFKVLLDTVNPPATYIYTNLLKKDTSFTRELESEAQYYLQVVGVDSSGRQAKSEIRSFSTPMCGNAYLKSISLSSGSLRKASNRNDSAFDPRVYDYEIHLLDTSKGVTITPVLDDASAALKINNSPSASGKASAEFKIGQTISVEVTSSDNKSLRTYRFLVRFKCSNDAHLAGLTVYASSVARNYTPAFKPDTIVYRDTVVNTDDTLRFVPRAIDPKASIWVKNEKLVSGATSSPVAIKEGRDTVLITVISECFVDTMKYQFITLRLLPSEAALSNLTVSAGTLMPAFQPDMLHYTDTLENAQDTITIVPTARDIRAVVTVNGDTVASASKKKISNLQIGPNTLTIIVFAADGKTQRQYAIALYRKSNSNTLLSLLEVSAGQVKPAFSETVFEYRDTIAYTTDSIAVKARAKNQDCKLYFNENSLKPDTFSAKVYLPAARLCTLNVKVRLPDGSQETVYRILSYRMGNPESKLTRLEGAPNDSLTLQPAFKDTVYQYYDTVPNHRESVSIIAEPKDRNAIVTINGDTVNNQFTTDVISLKRGGLTTITVKVYAQDGIHSSIYTIRLLREANFDAFLGSLKVSHGTLQPSFSFDNYIYDLEVSDTVQGMYCTPTARDSNATIRISATSLTATTVKSGTQSPAIPLAAGTLDTIRITVIAENGITQKPYKIAVYRKARNDANLSGLKASSPDLRPAFAAADTMYYDTVLNRIDTVRVSPFARDSKGAMIYVNGKRVLHGAWSDTIKLAAGNNVITVLVYAEDQSTAKRYYVNIYRDTRSDDARLSGLATSGRLRPIFAGTTYIYRDTVDEEDTIYSVTATTSLALAAIRINGQLTASGTAKAVRLSGATDTIRILVTAENPATSQEYRILVLPGGSARLTALTVSAGTLVPAFDPEIVDYRDTVSFAVDSLSVTPTAKDALAGTKVNGTTVLSGNSSPKFALRTDSQTITVVVTASTGGAQKEYRVAVVRLPLDTNILLSPADGATLSGWNLQYFTWKTVSGCTFKFDYYNASTMARVGGATGYSTDTMYVLTSLPGNTSYKWRVTIRDWKNVDHYSPYRQFTTPNHPPAAPGLSAPANDSYYGSTATAPLAFTWTASAGGDAGETVTYLFCFGKTAVPPLKSSGLTALTYSNQIPLDTGAYYWRVAAYDALDTTYSVTQTFVVYDTVQLTNILISPVNGSAVATWTPTATWHSRSGFDYIPYYGTDSTAVTTAVGTWAFDTVKACSALNGNRTYFWRVRLRKGTNDLYSPVWKFTTPNHAPVAPTTLSTPWDGIVYGDVPASWTYTWSGASDADAGDVLHYNVYLGPTNPPTTIAAANAATASATISMGSMTAGTYYWQVEASDGRDSTKSTIINKMVLGRTNLDPDGTGWGEVVDSIYNAELDVFEYDGKTGDIIQIQMAPWKRGFDPQIGLYTGNVQRKSAVVNNGNDDSWGGYGDAFLMDTLPSDGVYRIIVGDAGADESGRYQLSVVSFTTKNATAPIVSYDQLWDRYVSWNDVYAFKFVGMAGDRISLRVTPQIRGLDPKIVIIAPDGTGFQSTYVDNGNNDSWGGYTALYLQDITLPQTGTYTVFLSDWGQDESGTYTSQFLKLQ